MYEISCTVAVLNLIKNRVLFQIMFLIFLEDSLYISFIISIKITDFYYKHNLLFTMYMINFLNLIQYLKTCI